MGRPPAAPPPPDHDRDRGGLRRHRDGSWTVPGLARPDEVRGGTGVDVPDAPAYETLGGFVMARLGRIPVVGDEVAVGQDAFLRVVRMEGRRVERLRLRLRAPAAAGVPAPPEPVAAVPAPGSGAAPAVTPDSSPEVDPARASGPAARRRAHRRAAERAAARRAAGDEGRDGASRPAGEQGVRR
ncbi:transporter associated domain-containing protein [Kineococcus sp. SYSU DK004]|uniref:transporter associated domain-containing protein n=1 Tax=Kineococcus sp. SYSU DK004 TaxID=3383125 RepID=UPI003D7C43AE